MKYYAKKHLEITYENGIELIKSEYKILELNERILDFLEEKFGEEQTNDYEESFSKGIAYSWESIFYYDVGKLLDAIETEIELLEEEGNTDDSFDYENFKDCFDELEKYREWIIYPDIPEKLN